MAELLLESVTISGLPLDMHQGKVLSLKPINYLFGPNGSGKTLVLKQITDRAKQEIRNQDKIKDGFFAQYITATPQQNFYQDTFQIMDRKASEFDLESPEITGQIFYQHLAEYPEISIKIRDALQKYLGRYPNLIRRGINNVMSFLREEEDIPGYSPQSESDGLRRLSLLLTYIYHPKCSFLAIDEPELYLHPDMISFLIDEVLSEMEKRKQFVFATHSPEMIRVGKGTNYGYFYFNLKDKLKDTHIIQASEVGAEEIIEKLGYLLDINRRAFLYAPVTVFVEGIIDEEVYQKLKKEQKVVWTRRVFMVNTGGKDNIFNFWLLWKKFDKDCRVIMDSPQPKDENDFEKILNQFCQELGIETSLSLEEKKNKLAENMIFIAPYIDVLNFADKNIEIKDLDGIFSELDVGQHVDILQKAIKVEEPVLKRLRKEEEEWLSELAKDIYGSFIKRQGNQIPLDEALNKLKKEHPNLNFIKLENDPNFLVEIRFKVSINRELFVKFSKSTDGTEIGVL